MHHDALTPERLKLFTRLPEFPGFYLAGGTALALQLGHRQSIDFDLFSEQSIKSSLLSDVESVFSSRTITPLVNNSDELTVRVADTKLTFLHYPFPVLDEFVELDGVRSLSVRELAATKAYTIGRRGSLKDYVDLHAVLNGGHTTLNEICELAQRKYSDVFNARLFLEQLVWLDDIEDEPITFLREPVTKHEVQHFLIEQIKQFSLEE